MVVLARRELENSTAGEYVDVLVAVDCKAATKQASTIGGAKARLGVRVDVGATGARVLHLVHYIHY